MSPVQAATRAGVLDVPTGPGQSAARLRAHLVNPEISSRVRLVLDLFVLYLAAALALFADNRVSTTGSDHWLALLFPIAVTAAMRARRAPDEHLDVSMLDTFIYVLGVVSLVAMLSISVDSLLGGTDPLVVAPRLWVFSVVYLGIERAILVSARRQAMASGELGVPTLIVGAGIIGGHVVKRLTSESRYGLRPVGFVDSDPLLPAESMSGTALPVLGGLSDLGSAIARTGARHVILAFSGERDRDLVEAVRSCQTLGVGVSLVPRLYETINERATLDHLGGLPLLTLHPVDPRGWQFAIKHTIDRTVAALGLLIMFPVVIGVALAVRLSSPGPILFRQRRVGRDSHEFDLLKFRTMRMPDDAALALDLPDGVGPGGFNLPDGVAPGGVEGIDRRTRVGRILRDLSLDELPQLINVLRGDMSLVGPRPERPEYVARFARDIARYEDRHRVRSGITGWAQVHGLRGQTSIDDRVEWDNYYIQNWSVRLDLRILLFTVAEVLRQRDSAGSLPDDPTLPLTARRRRSAR